MSLGGIRSRVPPKLHRKVSRKAHKLGITKRNVKRENGGESGRKAAYCVVSFSKESALKKLSKFEPRANFKLKYVLKNMAAKRAVEHMILAAGKTRADLPGFAANDDADGKMKRGVKVFEKEARIAISGPDQNPGFEENFGDPAKDDFDRRVSRKTGVRGPGREQKRQHQARLPLLGAFQNRHRKEKKADGVESRRSDR